MTPAPVNRVSPGATMDCAAVYDLHEGRWMRRFHENRPRRVLLLLTAVWIVQAFDLGFTLVAHREEAFEELNPAADWALQRGAIGAIVFKVVLVLLGSVILWCCRKRILSECLLWLVFAACVGLSLRWRDYFAYALDSPRDIATVQSDDVSARPGASWMERCARADTGAK